MKFLSKLPILMAFAVLALAFLSPKARAEFDSDEPFLYTAGFPTADVLREKEWLFSPQGWASYGLDQQNTFTVDWWASMWGAPAGYYRHQFSNSTDEAQYSLEIYGLYCTRTVTVSREHAFIQEHERGQTWAHFENTFNLSERTRVHAYFGATYGDQIHYRSDRTLQFEEKSYKGFVNPDFGVAIEYFENPSYKFTFYGLYGNTFYYVDQAPHKYMFGGGFQFAPFAKERRSFLSRFRLELNGYWVYLPDPRYTQMVIPFLPVLYWQWEG